MRPDQWHADADQQSERTGCFEGGNVVSHDSRHVRVGHGRQDPVIAGDVGHHREVGDEQAADNDVRGEHVVTSLDGDRVPEYTIFRTSEDMGIISYGEDANKRAGHSPASTATTRAIKGYCAKPA